MQRKTIVELESQEVAAKTKIMNRAAIAIGMAIAIAASVSCKSLFTESDPTATPPARKVLGEALPFKPADITAEELESSIVARRRHAWSLFEQINTAASIVPDPSIKIPLWQTWYTDDEFRAMVSDLFFYFFDEEQREKFKDPSHPFEISETLAQRVIDYHWNRTLTGNDATRYDRLVGRIKQSVNPQVVAAGINGAKFGATNLYSPGTIRHILKSLHKLYHCKQVAPANQEDLACVAAGAEPTFDRCLLGPFPKDSALIKASWIANESVVDFATDAASMDKLLAEERPTWKGEPIMIDDNEQIYTVETKTTFQTVDYRLVGLHVTTKEIPEWFWATYWWSKNADKNNDYGADRPDLPPPWNQYKTCAGSSFVEDHQITGADESLDATLQATHMGNNRICSNPYLEHHEGWARTNCIGCHQHADVVTQRNMEATKRPALCQQTHDFPADFLWSLDSFQAAARQELSNVPDIIKITARNCGQCHGTQAGEVPRITTEQDLFENMQEIACRIESEDEDYQMPPGGDWVAQGQKEYLRNWLASRGARCN